MCRRCKRCRSYRPRRLRAVDFGVKGRGAIAAKPRQAVAADSIDDAIRGDFANEVVACIGDIKIALGIQSDTAGKLQIGLVSGAAVSKG